MVKLLKQSSILALRKTQGVNGGLAKGTTNANPVNDIQTKISLPTDRKTISFLEPKATTERMASGTEAGYRGELKGFERRSQDGGS